MKMRRIRKIIFQFLVLVLSCFSFSFFSQATGEWIRDGDEWYLLDSAGNIRRDYWEKNGENYYYLNDDGLMARNLLLEESGNLYYFGSDGVMIRNNWVHQVNPEEDGYCWYYFGSNGKAYRGNNDSFKKNIGGSTYIFDSDGRMLTGWIDENGNTLTELETPFVDGLYYCDEDGAIYKERWLQYSGDIPFDMEGEIAEIGYSEYQEIWFYFDSNGKKLRSVDNQVKEKTINSKTYGFDENGVMLAWWGTQGVESEKVKFYSGKDGGQLLKDSWIWMFPSENLEENDFKDEEASWWRTGSDGKVYKNTIKTINGKKYAFDDIGRMQTGFVMFDGYSQYVGQYEVDAWESKDFINGDVIGLVNSDLYLFSPDELNDGSMQTGKEIRVELADGIFTFGFDKSGRAYGNRNTLVKKENKYYINGLRLEAESDSKYGVLLDQDDIFRAVNTTGAAVKGNKVVGDGHGGWMIVVNGEFKAYLADGDKPRWYNGADGMGFYHYNKDSKDKYEGGLIAGINTTPVTDNLPDQEKLNFD